MKYNRLFIILYNLKYYKTIFADSNNEKIVEFTPNYSINYCKVAKDTYAIQLNNQTSYTLKFKTHIGNIVLSINKNNLTV